MKWAVSSGKNINLHDSWPNKIPGSQYTEDSVLAEENHCISNRRRTASKHHSKVWQTWMQQQIANDNNDDMTDYFTPCACARGNKFRS